MTDHYHHNVMKAFYYYVPISSTLMVLLLFHSHPGFAIPTLSSPYDNIAEFDNELKENLEIIKVIPFNNSTLSSMSVDPTSDLIYVSVRPDYSYNYSSTLCLEQNVTNSAVVSSSIFLCSAIYILDGNTGQTNSIIRLRPGEEIHATAINPYLDKIYASGEYNYLVKDFEGNGEELIQYEDDVVYIINNTNYASDNNNNTKSNGTNGSPSQMTAADIQRVRLYGEMEEGKEGDMSGITVDATTNRIYAGIRYFQGGQEGLFIILNNNTSSSTHNSSISMKPNSNNTSMNNLTSIIKFIPIGDIGPEQILVNSKTNSIYTSLENDNFIAIIDGSTNTEKEKVILQQPRAMSINPSTGLLYVASGDSHWFNIIDMSTNKVIAANTQISHPIASVVNNITGRVYAADCPFCDDFDFTRRTSIYELDSNGLTINWKTYENISIEENELVINPFTNKLYAIGTDIPSGTSNLYIIDISFQ